ncbi:type II secretion system F family protein [Candidatus Wolfebacteria bacterium]|nr:type II secretion system F family protein [Candidatus Wolfebacteria bacterium]
MKFHYVASQSGGKIIEGEMEAKGVGEVLVFLASKGLKPISLKREKELEAKKGLRIFETSINVADKIFLTKYLALMLKIGTDLFRAIDILIADFDKPAVRSFLFEIRENLEKGQPFYLNFERHPQYFSSVFVNLVKAGESSGNLEKTFERLSIDLQKEQDLRHEIRSALIYPVLLLAVSTAVVFFLITFALPKISKVFTESGFTPPVFSRIVFSVGLFLNDYFLVIIIFLILSVLGILFLFKNIPTAKRIFQRMIRKLPVIGALLKIIAIQRFSSTFSSLLSSGIPILDALDITAQVAGDEELKQALNRISREGIAKGLTIGEAFRQETVFPKTVVNLVAISEKSGNLANILFTLSDFYESEIKASVKTMVTFVEPVLLVVIGAIVGIIALAVIVPVYQLVGSV